MKTLIHLKTWVIVISVLFLTTITKAQNDIYASYITDSSSDFQNAYRAVDANRKNYANLSNLLTLLSSSHLKVGFGKSGEAGAAINIIVRGTGSVLTAGLLNNITVRLYDSLGNNVANGNGSSLLQLYLLSSGTNTYAIRFQTSPIDTYKFKQVRIEFNNILTLSLLSELRVYGIYYQEPCPTVLANSVHSYGTNLPLTGYVSNPNNAVDATANNYATLTVPLDLLSIIPPAYLDLGFTRYGKGGDFVGFTVAQSSSLLSLGLLSNIAIRAYNSAGTLVASKSGFSLLDLKLLAGSSGRYMLGFETPAGNYNIAYVRITLSGVLALLQDINVYNAFHFNSNRKPVSVIASGPLDVCAGGSVTLTAVDSSGGNHYLWSNGATTQSITVSTAGDYSVQVEDTSSCSRYSIPVTVTMLPAAPPVIKGDTVLCAGKTGTINVLPIYSSYMWSTGATTPSVAIAAAGKYYLRTTDTNGCIATDTVVVTNNLLNIGSVINNATCSNGTDGSIVLAVSGGSGVYTYLWSNTGITNTAAGLAPGIYTVFIKDNLNNCTFPRSYTIAAKNTLSITSSVVNTTDSGKTDGQLQTKIIGGSGSYSYLWSNGATTATVNNIAAGVYYLRVTDNVNGCMLYDTLAVNDGNNPLTVNISVTNSSACNTTNGSLTANVTGGSGSYSYLWSTGATTATVSGLAAGSYYVTVHDNVRNYKKTAQATVVASGILTVAGSTTNAACGSYNGTINLTVTGGSGSYAYLWSNNATTANITNLQPGTYIVKVTDNVNGCVKRSVFNIGQTGGPTATLTTNQPLCSTNANGSITVTATNPNYRYSWSTGITTQNISGLSPGNYTLIITDIATGCSSTYSTTLSATRQIEITAAKKNNSSCPATPNGSITLAVTGGTTPYTYTWSNGATTPAIINLATGNYAVSVADANGCRDSLTTTIQNDTSKMLNITIDSVKAATCYTLANGKVSTHAAGGAGPYTYSWTNGANTATLANVAGGTYTVTVTDAAGCTAKNSATVTTDTATAVRITTDNVTQVNCTSSTSGEISTHAERGQAPYSYVWSTGATMPNITGLAVGVYSVIATDAAGCKDTANITVSGGGSLIITVTGNIPAACSTANNGSASISVSGGAMPYVYSWSNGATGASITNVPAGTYDITVTEAGGCIAFQRIVIGTNTANAVTIIVDSVIKVNCISATSGRIYTHTEKGATPYMYVWNTGATTAAVTGLSVGTYSITATDADGCKDMKAVNLLKADVPAITVNSVTATACNTATNGKVDITVSSGTLPYSYTWSNGTHNEDIANVPAGTYSITVTDGAGCTATLGAIINTDLANAATVIVDSVIKTNCSGPGTGKIYTHAEKGIAPYTYLWNTGTTTATLTGLSAGTYSITVTDAAGCKDTKTTSVLQASAPAIAVNSVTATACNTATNGKIDVTATGGTLPYSYTWSNGSHAEDLVNVAAGTYSITVTDGAGCATTQGVNIIVDLANVLTVITDSAVNTKCSGISSGKIYTHAERGATPYSYMWNTGSSAPFVTGLSAGTYSVIVTDANGCKDTAASVISKTDTPVITISGITPASCYTSANGSATAVASGGTTPYSYLWSNGNTTGSLTGVLAGNYTITVTDANGCSGMRTVSIAADVSTAVTIVTDSVVKVNCLAANSGKIYTHAERGQLPYSYAWNTGVASSNITGLAAGTYSVVVTDAVGCKDTAIVALLQNDAPVLTVSSTTAASCFNIANGSATISVSSGTAPYTYLWSNGNTSASISVVFAGAYSVTVKDAAECSATIPVQITTDTANSVRIITDSVVNPNCLGLSSGSIYTHAERGQLPYSYSWNNGNNSPSVSGLPAGIYNLVVTDAIGCKDTATATIVNTGKPIISLNVTETKCNGDNNGSIAATASGGSGQYNYRWNTGRITPTITDLTADDYIITVTDVQTGCVATDTAKIDQPPVLNISAVAANESCNGNDGGIVVNVSGGRSPYKYTLPGNAIGNVVNSLTRGNYTVAVADASGCTKLTNAEVGKNTCDTSIVIHDVITPNGDGINDNWVIDGIFKYPNASVQIFDKWGDVVYGSDHYNNTWNGIDKHNNKLASGTYYYLLKLNAQNASGGKNTFTGFIMIQ